MPQPRSQSHELHQLVYVSRARAETPREIGLDIVNILNISVINNRRRGLTGALLACEGCFVQALEGSPESVSAAFGQISTDARHYDIRIIKSDRTDRREFDGWAMCAKALSPDDTAIVEALEDKPAFDPLALDETSALTLLHNVRDIQAKNIAFI